MSPESNVIIHHLINASFEPAQKLPVVKTLALAGNNAIMPTYLSNSRKGVSGTKLSVVALGGEPR